MKRLIPITYLARDFALLLFSVSVLLIAVTCANAAINGGA